MKAHTLIVKRKVRNLDKASSVKTNLRHPCDHACVGYPRIKIFHLVQIFISANSLNFNLKFKNNRKKLRLVLYQINIYPFCDISDSVKIKKDKLLKTLNFNSYFLCKLLVERYQAP